MGVAHHGQRSILRSMLGLGRTGGRNACGTGRLGLTEVRLRKLTKMQTMNDGTRSLIESVMLPDVIVTLRDWAKGTALTKRKSTPSGQAAGVLIGGLGLSYHCKPRYTADIDLLFLEPADIPEAVPGFTPTTACGFRHERTGVEVNIATPPSINVPKEIAEQVFVTAILSNRIHVATPSGLAAIKLFGRRRVQDDADIVALIKTRRVNLAGWPLTPAVLTAFEGWVEITKTDPH
jgi:hypothetical protein